MLASLQTDYLYTFFGVTDVNCYVLFCKCNIWHLDLKKIYSH